MATVENVDPQIPESAQVEWAELIAISPQLTRARHDTEQLSTRSKQLVISLLRKGVRRRDLIGRPFSAAFISRIQASAGLTKRPKSVTLTSEDGES